MHYFDSKLVRDLKKEKKNENKNNSNNNLKKKNFFRI